MQTARLGFLRLHAIEANLASNKSSMSSADIEHADSEMTELAFDALLLLELIYVVLSRFAVLEHTTI